VGFFALGEVGDSEMRAGLSTIQQTLTPEATNVLNHSIAKAGRRNHGHMTPLHVAARSDPLSPISADEVLEQVVEVLDLVLSKVEYLKATDVVWFAGVVLLSSAWSGLGFYLVLFVKKMDLLDPGYVYVGNEMKYFVVEYLCFVQF